MFKKLSAIVLALAMMLTLSTVMVSAAGKTVAVTIADDVYEGETFELNITVSGVAKYAGAVVKFSFDPAVIQAVDEEGNASEKWTDIKINGATGFMKEMDKIMDNEAGTFEYTVLPDSMHDDYVADAPYLTDVANIATIRFKALTDGDMAIEFSKTEVWAYDEVAGKSAAVVATDATADLAVLEIPEKPFLEEGAKVDGTLKVGETLTASYVFNNGKSTDTTSDDASTYAWYTGTGEDRVAIENATAKTYVLTDAEVGKVVTVDVTPNTTRTPADKLHAKGDLVTLTAADAAAIVMPADGYAPEATATIAKITAKKAAEAEVEIDTYDVATTEKTTYAWYKVAGVESADAAIDAVKKAIKEEAQEEGVTVTAIEGETAVKTSAEAFVKEDKGNYGVVVVKPVATINGSDYAADAVEEYAFAACEIKVAKTGGAVQGGASLVTGTNTPATDDKDDETTTPGTDVKDDDIISDTNPDGNPTDGKEYGAAQFTDISKESYAWAYDHIDALAKAKIVKGMTETTFGPEGETTVAQAVALAVRISGLTAENAKTDKVDEAHWSYAEMAIADTAGILAILGDKVEADKAASRETVFAIVYAAVKAAEITLPTDAEAITYSDASSIAEGAVEAIDALTKAGVLNGMGDGTIAPKANITRAQIAKILGVLNTIIAE